MQVPVQIVPLTEADVPRAVRLQLNAFKDHPRTPIVWPNGYTDELYAYYEATRIKELNDRECRFMKAVDRDTGEMLGISEWTFKLDNTTSDAQYAQQLADMEREQPPPNWPPGGNWELRRFYKINLTKILRDTFGDRPYILLDILTVDTALQGKSIGSALLEWGVRQADDRGIVMGLESTPAGLALYQKFGFKEAQVIKADMHEFGWKESYDENLAKRVWMIREPQTI